MKAQNLMLNESIFNALIKGHVKNGFVSTWPVCCSLCFSEHAAMFDADVEFFELISVLLIVFCSVMSLELKKSWPA